MKTERQDLEVLRQDISTKVHKHEFEMLGVQLKNFQIESETKIKAAEKDIDDFVETIQNELSNMKNSMIQSLNKKADFSMLDRLNEQVSKKVDSDLLKHTQQQLKTDLQHEIAICKGDLSHELHGKDTKFQERLEKTEINSDRALDEIYQYKEVIRSLQEERKRDIEETADFVKQLMDNFKDELQRDVYQFKDDIEKLKKDMFDRTTVQEML